MSLIKSSRYCDGGEALAVVLNAVVNAEAPSPSPGIRSRNADRQQILKANTSWYSSSSIGTHKQPKISGISLQYPLLASDYLSALTSGAFYHLL